MIRPTVRCDSKTFRAARHLMATTAMAAGLIAGAHQARALDGLATPAGEHVVGGAATFDRAAPGQLTINQGTDRAVINWDSFNIGKSATTQFVQPSSKSLAVNRVIGGHSDPTQILGTLKANGNIMVLDKNGILFGRDSRIDVGGIVASTGDVDTASIMGGGSKIDLHDFGAGAVVNEGTINVADAGLAAFVAPGVQNSGVINARLGRVSLASGGETATVDLYGDGLVELAVGGATGKALVKNSGAINAEGGTVQMTATAAKGVVDDVINTSGIVKVASVTQKGGKIILSGGKAGKVNVTGRLDASGVKGGSVTMTGDSIAVAQGASVKANGLAQGGDITILADKNTTIGGNLSAAGGGGFIETSAIDTLDILGTASILAPDGVWTLDPADLIIDDGNKAVYEGQLAVGDTNISVSNNLWFSTLLSWNSGHKLTGFAGHDLHVGGLLNQSGLDGNGDISLKANNDIFFSPLIDGTILVRGNNVSIKAGDEFRMRPGSVGGSGSVQTNGAGDITIETGHSTDDGELEIDNGYYVQSFGGTVKLKGSGQLYADADTVRNSGTGAINIFQNKGGSIQAAVDALHNTGTGLNTIKVGRGKYNEDVTVDEDNVLLRGASNHKSIVNATAFGFKVTGDDVTLDGFEVNGGDYGILVQNADNAAVKNNIIRGSSIDGIFGKNGTGIAITGNDIANIGVDGINVRKNEGTTTISGNTVNSVGDEGIEVHGSAEHPLGAVIIINNILDGTIGSGIGDDGIQVLLAPVSTTITGNTVIAAGSDGVEVHQGENVVISDNDLFDNKDQGIEVTTGGSLIVSGNDVERSRNEGIFVTGMDSANINGNSVIDTGRDGIHVQYTGEDNVHSPFGGFEGLTDNDFDVLITGNTVSNTGGNGIDVLYDGWSLIKGNIVTNAGQDYGDGILVDNGTILEGDDDFSVTKIIGNTVTDALDNGIHVVDVNRSLVDGNSVSFTESYPDGTNGILVEAHSYADDGDDDEEFSSRETGHLTFALFEGAEDFGYETIVSNNLTVDNAPQNGIMIDGDIDSALIASNIVTNNGINGLFAKGPDLGTVTLTGNRFTNNPTGARFESGLIDLTGASNTFNGGEVALLFAPFDLGEGGFAGMTLAGDTIGTTVFNGQSQFYVQLANGAFFDPGTPTLLDGTHASFNGLVPDVTGGNLTQAQYDGLEDRIFHYNDDQTLGLFFFGVVAPEEGSTQAQGGFDQEDAFNRFALFNVPGNGLNVTITGLPTIPGFNNPAPAPFSVANIEPAAGGDEGSQTPKNPQEVEPAAGGDETQNPPQGGEETSCWSDAVQSVGAGKPVNISYATGPDSLNDLSKCQNGSF